MLFVKTRLWAKSKDGERTGSVLEDLSRLHHLAQVSGVKNMTDFKVSLSMEAHVDGRVTLPHRCSSTDCFVSPEL